MSDFVYYSSKLLKIVKQSDVEVSNDINTLVKNVTKCIQKADVDLSDIVGNWIQGGIKQDNGGYRQFREDGDKFFQSKQYADALNSYR